MHVRGRRKKQDGRGTEVVKLAPPELYDLATDLAEARNVAAQHSDVVAHLQRRVAEWEAAIAKAQEPEYQRN